MTRPNWRTGAPAGNRNALKSGRYTAEQRAFDRRLRMFLRQARQHIAWAKAVWAREALERRHAEALSYLPQRGEVARARPAAHAGPGASGWGPWSPAASPHPEHGLLRAPCSDLPALGERAEAAGIFSKSTFAEFRQKPLPQQPVEEFSKTTVAEFRQKLPLRQLAEEFLKSTFADFRQKRETGPPSLLPMGRTEIQDIVFSRLRAA